MSLTTNAREFYKYRDSHDFISPQVLEGFRVKLEREGNIGSFNYGLEKFLDASCPNCNASGVFKWHFLGRLKHPECGWSWYVGIGTYAVEQLRAVFRTGMEISADAANDAEKRGEKHGCISIIFEVLLGVFLRLPFAILMIPIQAIFSIAQKKPEKRSES